MFNHSSKTALIEELKTIVGSRFLLATSEKVQPYAKGFRFGQGEAMAVAKPQTLVQIWQLLQACHKAGVIVIMQAANTGLTGGSTPDGNDYDRPIVIINTLLIDQIQILEDGQQVVALAGSTLFELEDKLDEYDRDPHSVLGSSSIGASIVGGVCNNSGGALIQRGPAYTELALYAKITSDNQLVLVNNLGIELGQEPEEILNNLESQNYKHADIQHPDKLASDDQYDKIIRDVDADTPSRFNNDERLLFEASGCAGKLAVFAVRLDTFEKAKKKRVFYLGINDTELMTRIRRDILSSFKNLPLSGDYFDRECYKVSKVYGKDTFVVIDKLGSKTIPKLFSLKRTVDRIASRFSFLPSKFSDRMMQALSYLLPNHLPKRMDDFHKKFDIHFIVETEEGDAANEAQAYFDNLFRDENNSVDGDFFVCTEVEAKKAVLQRFAVGGAIGRYHALHAHNNGPMMTIDVALRRNEKEWLTKFPPEIEEQVEVAFIYGHFFCHVMHQNYILKKGADAKAIKHKIIKYFKEKGAELPSEHNVGHEYEASETLKKFYRDCDPTNTFNPGIGKTSKLKNWV